MQICLRVPNSQVWLEGWLLQLLQMVSHSYPSGCLSHTYIVFELETHLSNRGEGVKGKQTTLRTSSHWKYLLLNCHYIGVGKV